jgi:hypothetical protein
MNNRNKIVNVGLASLVWKLKIASLLWTSVSTLVTKHPPLSTQILKLRCMNIGAMIAYRVAGASKWVVKVAMLTLVILGRATMYPMVRWELGRGSLFEG